MRTWHDKLVRDRIPQIIASDGAHFALEIYNEESYRAALLAKLDEEAREAASAPPQDLIKELADLFEVIDAALEAHAISRSAVLAAQARRRAERGGFTRRLRLMWTEREAPPRDGDCAPG